MLMHMPISEHFVFFVAASINVSDQVQNFFSTQLVGEPCGHQGNRERITKLNCVWIDRCRFGLCQRVFNDSGSTPALSFAGGGSACGRFRRAAVGKNSGNAWFYNVFGCFSINYVNMQSVRIPALRAPCRKCTFYNGFLAGFPWRLGRILTDCIWCIKVWFCKVF